MIVLCQVCKMPMDVPDRFNGIRSDCIIWKHEDCSNAAHADTFSKLRMLNLRIKNAKLMKANRERKEKK